VDDDSKEIDEHKRKHGDIYAPKRTHPAPQESDGPLTPTWLPRITVIGGCHHDTPGYSALLQIDTGLNAKVSTRVFVMMLSDPARFRVELRYK
jgi:hypothetical protein